MGNGAEGAVPMKTQPASAMHIKETPHGCPYGDHQAKHSTWPPCRHHSAPSKHRGRPDTHGVPAQAPVLTVPGRESQSHGLTAWSIPMRHKRNR